MVAGMNNIYETEHHMKELTVHFLREHPIITLIGAVAGIPVVLLAAVFFSTLAVMIPISLLFGWI